MNEAVALHWFPVLCCVIGWYAHIWLCSREMSKARNLRVWPHDFMAARPARSFLTAFGAFWLYLGLMDVQAWAKDAPILSPFTAAGAGFMSEWGLDKCRGLWIKRMGGSSDEYVADHDITEPTIMQPPTEDDTTDRRS